MSLWPFVIGVLIFIALVGLVLTSPIFSDTATENQSQRGSNLSVRKPSETKPNAGEILDKKETEAEETSSNSLPEDMPYLGWLSNAGITTWNQLKSVEDLEEIDYIGEDRAEEISVWLSKNYPGSKHARKKNVLSHK